MVARVQINRLNLFNHNLGFMIDFINTMFEALRQKPSNCENNCWNWNVFIVNYRWLNQNMEG